MSQKDAKLTDEMRTFVVQALACFDAPGVVVKALKQEFDVEVKPQSVQAYDPTKHSGRNLAAKWKHLFEATRKAFLDDSAQIGIANRNVRLKMLERAALLAEQKGNTVHMAELLEQAAKECGNSYTNKQIHNVKASGGLVVELVQYEDTGPDQ